MSRKFPFENTESADSRAAFVISYFYGRQFQLRPKIRATDTRTEVPEQPLKNISM